MGSNMIKDTCLQQVDALQTRTLGPGSWCTAHFLLAQTHRKEKHITTIRNSTPIILKSLQKVN